MLTLSAPIFYADRAAGTYQITGTADAGSEILYGKNGESVYAAGDGKLCNPRNAEGTANQRCPVYPRAGQRRKLLCMAVCLGGAAGLQTYAVTVTTDGNGTASADPSTTVAGAGINPERRTEYGLTTLRWRSSAGGVTIENERFTMPDGDVEVKAIFRKGRSVCDPAPTATAKPNNSPTTAPLLLQSRTAARPPRLLLAAKPNSGATPAPAATTKPRSSPTPGPAARRSRRAAGPCTLLP